MHVTPFAWGLLGIAFVIATSAFAQTQPRQPGGAVTAPAPAGTMAPPATAQPGGRGATNIGSGGLTATALTASECKDLGGKTHASPGCKSGQACRRVDEKGANRSVCISVKSK
jgi:hypothetical protein